MSIAPRFVVEMTSLKLRWIAPYMYGLSNRNKPAYCGEMFIKCLIYESIV